MPRPRTPQKKAELTGAAAHDPQRFRDRREPITAGKPVGAPPSYMDKEAKAVWKELASSLGWLEYEDRTALEATALAVGQVRAMHKTGEPITGAMFAAMNTAIGKLGASPTDRSKVHQRAEDEDEDDPFAGFGKPN